MEKNADTGLYGRNKFKIGLFGMNCSNGLTMTTAPERWIASWDNNRDAAVLADKAGIDFLLPIGRWTGYDGKSDFQGRLRACSPAPRPSRFARPCMSCLPILSSRQSRW